MSLGRLALSQLRYQARWSLALGFCLVAALGLTSILAGMEQVAEHDGLRQALASSSVTVERTGLPDTAAFDSFQLQAARAVDAAAGQELAGGVPYAAGSGQAPVTLNGEPAAAPTSGSRLAPAYLAELEAHVSVVQGQLARDQAGDGQTQVTMAQDAADRAAIRLGDRVCLGPAGAGQQPWCVRIVGLWRPLDRGDPYWSASGQAVQLLMGQHDFFQALAQGTVTGTTGGRRYWPRLGAMEPGTAADLTTRLDRLSAEFSGPHDRVDATSLKASLDRFLQRRRSTGFVMEVLIAVAGALAVVLTGLAGGRLLDQQARELDQLVRFGWRRGRILTVALGELSWVWLAAATVFLLPAAVVLALLGSRPGGTADLLPAWPATAATWAAATVVLVLQAALAASRAQATPGPRSVPAASGRRQTVLELLAVLVALVALIVLRILGPPWPPQVSGVDDGRTLLVLVLLLAVLALAPLHLLRAAAGWLAARLRGGMSGLLAGWQLRQGQQHGGVAYLLVLAAALGTLAVAVLASERGPAVGADPLRRGLDVTLLIVLVSAPLGALAGFWLHFTSVVRGRSGEYRVLNVDGLPRRTLRNSLAIEQAVVLLSSVLPGVALGLVLAATVLAARIG